MKVNEIINAINIKSGNVPLEITCDILVIGDGEMEVTGVGTTFMATVDVIKEAIDKGINFIITHEPTYFTGMDSEDWLQNDPVYLEKKKLIEENNIAIWRFHDRMHIGITDLIYVGVIKELGWENYLVKDYDFPHLYKIPKTTLKDLAMFFKEKLEMDTIQLVGDHNATCENVGILVGGGSLGLGVEEMPMKLMNEQNLDVIVCGDITEWTLVPYARDASQLGMNKSLIIVGHERTEEAGMKHLPIWLEDIIPNTKCMFIDAKEPFTYL